VGGFGEKVTFHLFGGGKSGDSLLRRKKKKGSPLGKEGGTGEKTHDSSR